MRRRTTIAHVVLIVVAAVLTHVVGGRSTQSLTPDSSTYITPAKNLLAGRGLMSEGTPTTFTVNIPGFPNRPTPDTLRSPVVPLVIAGSLAAGTGLRGVIVLQCGLNLLTALAIYFFARSVLGRTYLGLFAALFFLANPAVYLTANQIGSETLFTALIFGTIILAYGACREASIPEAIGSGVLLGLAVLTRSIALFLVIPLAGVVLARTRRIWLTVALVVASQILPAAWMWRNYRATGVATISSAPAEGLLEEWAAGIHATRNSSHFERLTACQRQSGFRDALHRSRLPLFFQAMAIARSEGQDPTALNAARKAVYEGRLAMHIILRNPVEMAELMCSAVVDLLFFEPASQALDMRVRRPAVDRLLVLVVFVALLLVAVGIRTIHRSDATLAWLIGITIGYFTVGSAIPETNIRYAIVYLPVYAIALASGIAQSMAVFRKPPVPSTAGAEEAAPNK